MMVINSRSLLDITNITDAYILRKYFKDLTCFVCLNFNLKKKNGVFDTGGYFIYLFYFYLCMHFSDQFKVIILMIILTKLYKFLTKTQRMIPSCLVQSSFKSSSWGCVDFPRQVIPDDIILLSYTTIEEWCYGIYRYFCERSNPLKNENSFGIEKLWHGIKKKFNTLY